mmetsp:Transcript_33894/g.72273  ORF Transcript_33894/g.72273 Transcript_33894/m.72273 type:complete len:106 (+) Transcript_33894:44-361(+)
MSRLRSEKTKELAMNQKNCKCSQPPEQKSNDTGRYGQAWDRAMKETMTEREMANSASRIPFHFFPSDQLGFFARGIPSGRMMEAEKELGKLGQKGRGKRRTIFLP